MIDTKALRNKIIDLATSGKLSEHTDSNAYDELCHVISIQKNEVQRTINDEEKWTDIPLNWTWGRLVDLTTNDTLNDGNWVLSEDMVPDGDVKLIQLGSIGDCEYRYKGFKYLTETHFKELNGRQIYPRYLLINRLVVDKMVACLIPDIKGILMTAVDVCWVAPNDDLYSIEYLMYVMASSGVQQRVKELGHGVTRFRISKLNLIDIPFPLPPLEEQKQIVNIINDLFGLLAKIDTLQEKYSNDLTVLKSKIIDAGIQGKLTKQLPSDGDAEDLYAQIQEEKAKLVKEGKIKKEKALSEITDNDIPFDIPDNWRWFRFGELTNIERGGSPRPIKDYITDNEDGINWIKIGDVEKDGKYILQTKEKIIKEGEKKSRHVYPNDFLLTNSMSFGRPYISKIEGCIHDGWLLIRNTYNVLDLDYLYLMLSSKYAYNQFVQKASGATVDNLNIDKVADALIPLPPLAEQKRIAKIVEDILGQLN